MTAHKPFPFLFGSLLLCASIFTQSICDAISSSELKPDHRVLDRTEVDIEYLLNRITAALEKSWNAKPERYVFWASDNAGFVNQCRGFTASLALALVSGRRFIMSTPNMQTKATYFHLFDEPTDKFSIRADRVSKVHANMKGGKGNALWTSTQGRLGIDTEDYAKELDRVAEPRLKTTIVEHRCGCSFTMHFLQPKYEHIWFNIFGQTLRYDEIEVLIIMWLFQNPKAQLVQNANKVKTHVGWDNYNHTVFVQHRAWPEVKAAGSKQSVSIAAQENATMQCFLGDLLNFRALVPAEESILVYVTADAQKAILKVIKVLSGAIPNAHFTSGMAVFQGFHTTQQQSSEDASHSSSNNIDWYLMGQAEVAICAGGTYCVGSRARTGLGRSDFRLPGMDPKTWVAATAVEKLTEDGNVENDSSAVAANRREEKEEEEEEERNGGNVGLYSDSNTATVSAAINTTHSTMRDGFNFTSHTLAYEWILPEQARAIDVDLGTAPFESAHNQDSSTTPFTTTGPTADSERLSRGEKNQAFLLAKYTTTCPGDRTTPAGTRARHMYYNAISMPHRPLRWYRSKAMDNALSMLSVAAVTNVTYTTTTSK